MKRPLAGVMLGYVVGILLGHVIQLPPILLWGCVLAVVLITAILAWKNSRGQTSVIWAILVLSGWANLVSHTAVLAPDDLRNLIGNSAAAVTLQGKLAEPPQVRTIDHDGKSTRHTMVVLWVTALEQDTGWQTASGRVLATIPDEIDARFFPGQSVEVSGTLEPPAPPLADGLLDDRDYLRTRDIYYQLKTSSAKDWVPAPDARTTPPLTWRFLDWSQRTLSLGLPEVDEPLRLIWAMALGWRTAFTGDVGDPFLRAGTMHLFAIDGLRIALVSAMLLTLLRAFQLSRAVCGLVCIPAIWFYTAATGWEPSAIRATIMMTLIIFGWSLKRPTDLLNSLAATAFIILAWDPQELFAAGFQLSFLVVLIIGLMLPPLNLLVDRWLEFDPLVPASMISQGRRWGQSLLSTLLRYLALSLAAWIGSIPLSAKYFNLFSPISPLANMVAVPLGAGTLTSIVGSLGCGEWCPDATMLFNHSAWFFMVAMTQVSQLAITLPCAYYYVPAPSWTWIGLYYIVLVAGLTGKLRVPKQRFAVGVAVAGLTVIAGMCLWSWVTLRHEVRLTVLPLSGNPVVYVNSGSSIAATRRRRAGR